jgi:two-component system KDP operon response regulator KdpE
LKCLLIEDDREITEYISLTLGFELPECDLISCRLGTEGIDKVKNEKPDVIILDLGLPDIDGISVLDAIRSYSDNPVIILSVRQSSEDVKQGLSHGANVYMTKPFEYKELCSNIKNLAVQGA